MIDEPDLVVIHLEEPDSGAITAPVRVRATDIPRCIY